MIRAGLINLREHGRDACDDNIAGLKAKIGELTMGNGLPFAKLDKLEAGSPFARRG